MACSAIRSPLLRNSQVRHYAVAAAAQCSPASSNAEIKVLGNKVTLATVDNNHPISQISVVFKAGPRNETYDIQGASHYLRFCTGLTTSRSSGFAITRNLQQLGGELTATSDREHIAYTLKITRDNLVPALRFLEDAATRQEFRPWEISDELPRLRYEVSAVSDYSRLIELIYKAAYRDGLGYSLYCPKRNVGKLSPESLKHFYTTNCTGPRCVVVGSNVPGTEAEAFALNLEVSPQEGSDSASRYRGGEVRKERNSELASVAVAVEGASLKSQKDALAFAVLQKVAGDGPRVKWGACNNALHRAVSSAATGPFALAGFNAVHSDSGLFGFVLRAPADNAGAITKAAAKWLKAPQFSDDDVARAKACLKAAVLAAGDNSTLLHEGIGHQALLTGTVLNPQAIAAEVDKISASDVKKAAGKVSKGKLSAAAIGNLKTVPYLEEL